MTKPLLFRLISLLVMGLLTSFCSTQTENTGLITVKGTISDFSGREVSIITMDPLREMITLGRSTIDEEGKFSITIDADGPTEAFLIYAGKNAGLWLEPGFELEISISEEEWPDNLYFTGNGALENNYLVDMVGWGKQYSQDPVGDPEEFRDFIASYTSGALESLRNLKKHQGVSPLFLQVEKAKIADRFPVSFYRFSRNYQNTHEKMFELTEKEKQAWQNLDIKNDRLLLSDTHRRAVIEYLSNLTYDYARLDPGGSRVIGKEKAMKDLSTMDIHPAYIEYILATDLADKFEYPGFKYSRPDYDSFLIKYPESRFIDALNRKVDPWLHISAGQPAPDIEGTDPVGNPVSLQELKGKVVYIDVWASWCRPCYAEFPHSIKLSRQFSDNGSVVFAYISIDEDVQKWREALQKKPELQGVHMIVDGDWQSQFANDYVVHSIPRYIIIDSKGRIADAEALPPSSTEAIASFIHSLLQGS